MKLCLFPQPMLSLSCLHSAKISSICLFWAFFCPKSNLPVIPYERQCWLRSVRSLKICLNLIPWLCHQFCWIKSWILLWHSSWCFFWTFFYNRLVEFRWLSEWIFCQFFWLWIHFMIWWTIIFLLFSGFEGSSCFSKTESTSFISLYTQKSLYSFRIQDFDWLLFF